MPLINSIFSWFMKKRIHQIELFMKYPNEVQGEWFDELISTAAYTEWGKKYDYASINSLEEYKRRVPVQNYDDVKPYVDRIKAGEQNILWPSEVKWFAKSSGTTADRSKFIPVTREALEECHYKGGKDMLSIYCSNHENTKVFSGKTLAMGGSSEIIDPKNGSYHGDLSSIIIRNLPFWAEMLRTPDLETALMPDFEAKLEKMVRMTVSENVTNISGVPSWMLIFLNKILANTGKTDISEVWPNMEVFFHGGVSFKPYRKQFQEIISSTGMNYMETYNASEGFFGIQDHSDSDEMLLMMDYGIFYEFAPISEWEKEFPNTLSLDEVEKDVNYALIISTNGGLWRYRIGDTVKFTSLYPFRIRVSGRTKHFINAFGEELIIENAERALNAACEATRAVIEEYTAAPIYLTNEEAGGHEWLLEFKKAPDSLEKFTDILDAELKRINTDYEAKRKGNMALKRPKLRQMPKNSFYNWMKSRNKLGGQNKVPRLSNSREYVEGILNLMEQELLGDKEVS